MTQHYLVPAFFVVAADSQEKADELAATIQALSNQRGVALYLDETLPTAEVASPEVSEIHTVLDVPAVLAAIGKHAAAGESTDCVPIRRETLNMLMASAASHVEDVESGLEEGLYSKAENADLPAKVAALEAAQAILAPVRTVG